jgi:hypothetical protein
MSVNFGQEVGVPPATVITIVSDEFDYFLNKTDDSQPLTSAL